MMDDGTYHIIAVLATTALLFITTVFLLTVCATQVCSILFNRSEQKVPKGRVPPGPTPWPLLGNLPSLLSWDPHMNMVKLAQVYGPVMAFKVGTKPAVVISSSTLARDVIKIYDKTFRLRPLTTVVELLSPDAAHSYGVAGERWRQDRKLFTAEFMSIKRLDIAKATAEGEILSTWRELVESTESHKSSSGAQVVPVSLSEYTAHITGNLTSLMTFGKRLFAPSSAHARRDNKFSAALTTTFQVVTSYDIRDMLPVPSFVDLQGYSGRLKMALKDLEKTFLPIFDARRKEIEVDGKIDSEDFLGTLFNLESSGKPMPDKLKKELVLVSRVQSSVDLLVWVFRCAGPVWGPVGALKSD